MNEKYYYTDGKDQFGPYTLEELKSKPITPTTKMWKEGLADWINANEFPELQSMFTPQTPSIPKQPSYAPGQEHGPQFPPKTWLVQSILVTLFCCLPFGIAGIVNASKVESRFYAGDKVGAQRASDNAKK